MRVLLALGTALIIALASIRAGARWSRVSGVNGRVVQLTAAGDPSTMGGPAAAALAVVARSGRRILR
jgi:hypothetical protein